MAAFLTLAFTVLDVVLTGLVFFYIRHRRWERLGAVFAFHLIASCMVRRKARGTCCAGTCFCCCSQLWEGVCSRQESSF
jgi:hypothetical protein